MYTTNTASSSMPATYANLRRECEKLLNVATELENFTSSNAAFSDDLRFLDLKKIFHEIFLSVASLQGV